MTKVYLVMELVDEEYGNYAVYGAYASYEAAERAIEKAGQETVYHWRGHDDRFFIDEYPIEN